MASVFKRGGNGKGSWYAVWTDENGNQRSKSTRTTCRATAERIAAKLADDAAKRRDGLSDKRDERYAAEARKPIDAHLADFIRALAAEGNAAEYVEQTESRARAIVATCGAQTIADLTAFAVQKALDGLRGEGRALATCNTYLRSIKGFTSWLCRDKRNRIPGERTAELDAGIVRPRQRPADNHSCGSPQQAAQDRRTTD